ncbi:MAG: choloylglycine hydrolase family protein [Burkholderiales bacterium]|nr:choloylglycine hydrolase family protein [Burkholderiales bacterium]
MIKKLVLLITAAGFINSANACTAVNIKATDGSVVAGRTMEWTFPMDWNVLYYPEGSKFTLSAPTGSKLPSKEITSKYDVLGIDSGLANDTILEGQNSEGLGLSGNFLPGYTEYSVINKNDKNYISIIDFGRFVLSNYKSVDEVQKDITKYKVFGEKLSGVPIEPTVHFMITDRTGKSIVIEFINGQMKIFDKSIGIMTNSPNYDWHLTNIRNYVNLSNNGNISVQSSILGDVTGFSQGSSALGLPGDYTSSSRFVKAAFLAHYASKTKNANEAVNLVDHILNTVDIPVGIIASQENGQMFHDYTQWVAIKDLANNQLNFADYSHRANFIKIDMNKLKGSKEISIPISKLQYPNADITTSLIAK